MATFFYNRTLPAPRFVNVNGGTWSTLGVGDGAGAAATIPPAYVEGDDTVYLVQIVLQRTSSAANIRINLDTFISGSGGQAGPDFIPFVESRGLIRLSYAGGSRVFDIAESAIDDDAEPYAWQFPGSENAVWMRGLLDALVDDSTTPITIELAVPDGTIVMRATLGNPQGVRQRTGNAQGLSVAASVGRPRATVIGQAEGLSVNASVGAAEGYIGVGYAQGLTVEANVARPNGQKLTFAQPFPAQLLWELEARNRTRAGGRTWEWNDDDLTLPPPFGTHAENEKDRTRINETTIRITDPDNNSLGFTTRLATTGAMTLWSPSDPAIPRIRFTAPSFSANGTFNPTGHAGWADWWTAFSADITHELNILWEIPGIIINFAVGRPLGEKDRTKYGLPESIASAFSVGQPIARVKRAVNPVAMESVPGHPHAYAHAEFIQLSSAVGRPIARVKRAVQPIASAFSTGSVIVRVKRAVHPITAVFAVGHPQTPSGADPLVLEHSLGQPIAQVKRAVEAIALAFSTSRPHAFAHAEFIQIDSAVGRPIARVKRAVQPATLEFAPGRPAAILFGVPGSRTAGETVSESHNFGRYTLIRPDANSTWQFDANLTLPEPIMTASASPIAQAHVRANQIRFIRTGGQNPGFSDAFNASGRLTVARVGGSSFTITGPNFDHLGRMDPSGLEGYSEWWTAFSGGGTLSQLEVTWELDAAGFRPHMTFESAVGRPESRTVVVGEPMPLVAALSVGRPHGFAHAEFIASEFAVGRPRGYLPSVAAQPIASGFTTGKPHAFAHAEFIAAELSVGRPRGYLPKVAAGQISSAFVTGQPIVLVRRAAQPITAEFAVGMPEGEKRRVASAISIASELAAGRPRGYSETVAAHAISTEFQVGSPLAIVRRAAQPITAELVVGHPHAYAHGAGVQAELAVGRPRGYSETVAAHAITSAFSTSSPHAFAHAEFILFRSALGRPRGYITKVAAQGRALELSTGRPYTLVQGTAIVATLSVGRPRGRIAGVAAHAITAELSLGRPELLLATRGITLELSAGRPIALVRRAAKPLRMVSALGRPGALAHATEVVSELSVGRPVALVLRAAQGIASEFSLGMPEGIRLRIARAQGITAELSPGRPYAFPVIFPATVEHVPGRPSAIRYGVPGTLASGLVVGRPRGYSESVAAHAIASQWQTGLVIGERVRTSPAIDVVYEFMVGRPLGYFQAVALGIESEWLLGAPQRYFPRRRHDGVPERDARAEHRSSSAEAA